VIGQLVLKRIFQNALVSMDSNIYENWLVIIQKIQILRNFEKMEKSRDKPEKSVFGLPFLIQNLNFE
jgi:hypothetical protein